MQTQSYTDRLDPDTLDVRSTLYRLECSLETVWILETDEGTEIVPADVADMPYASSEDEEELTATFSNYIQGRTVHSGDRVNRWLARWTMPGYLDQGEPTIADTASEALIDLLGNDGSPDGLNGSLADWEVDALLYLAELADSGDPLALDYLDDLFAAER